MCLCIIPTVVLGNDFVWDDLILVAENTKLGDPAYLKDSVVLPFWETTDYAALNEFEYWRPLTTFTLWFTAWISHGWPPVFRLLSLILSAWVALTLLGFLKRILPQTTEPTFRLCVFALALLHPLNAELLSFVCNISDYYALALLLTATSLTLDVFRGDRLPRFAWVIGGLLFLACCAKEFAVLGIFTPLIAYGFARSSERPIPVVALKRFPVWLGCLAPATMYIVLRARVLSEAAPIDLIIGNLAPALATFPAAIAHRVLLPIPTGAHLYVPAWSWLYVGVSAVLLFLLISATVFSIRRKGFPSTALLSVWLMCLITLPSVIAVEAYPPGLRFPVRYFYVSVIVGIISVASILQPRWSKTIYKYALVGVLTLFSLLFWIRISEWNDMLTFYAAESNYHPYSSYERKNYLDALISRGQFEKAEVEIKKIDQTLSSQSDGVQAIKHIALAELAIFRDKDYLAAETHLKKALSLNPSSSDAVLRCAEAQMRQNDPHRAIRTFERAIETPLFTRRQKERFQQQIDKVKTLFMSEQK